MPDSYKIAGYAAVWDTSQNEHGYVFAPRAFEAALLEHKLLGTLPAMLWSHDPARVIGKWTEIIEDQHGLYVTGLIYPREGRLFAMAYNAGVGPGLSLGESKARPGEPDARTGRTRFRCVYSIGEISIVPQPLDGAAKITYLAPLKAEEMV